MIPDDRRTGARLPRPVAVPLSKLGTGRRARISYVLPDLIGRGHRLAALGVTAGAAVRVLQRFPVIVFECDQTELAVERAVATAIFVEVE